MTDQFGKCRSFGKTGTTLSAGSTQPARFSIARTDLTQVPKNPDVAVVTQLPTAATVSLGLLSSFCLGLDAGTCGDESVSHCSHLGWIAQRNRTLSRAARPGRLERPGSKDQAASPGHPEHSLLRALWCCRRSLRERHPLTVAKVKPRHRPAEAIT